MEETAAEALLREAVSPLFCWYDQNARILPWRSDPTPYRVWVSEIMLQQTRVEAVKPYFERFVAELPDVEALAAVPEERLLKLWEGLGYYTRARSLQRAAREMVSRYGGRLPRSYEALLSLPGFGPYTAGAVASIAYGIPAPAVDGNVLRVISRLTGSREDISRPASQKRIGEWVRSAIPEGRPGDFNQALMELGATVCFRPPGCGRCPLSALCVGRREGIAEELPVKAAKKPRRAEEKTVFLLLCGDKTALRRRGDTGLLAGLWEFPNVPGRLSKEEAGAYLAGLGVEALHLRTLSGAKHIFTHVEWHMTGYLAEAARPTGEGLLWVDGRELEAHSIPSAFRTYTLEALRLLCGYTT